METLQGVSWDEKVKITVELRCDAMLGWAAQGRRRALFTSYELTGVSPFLPPFPFPFFRAALPPLLNAIN
jgi:hypothetical protein